jgi:hypothetical protein
MLHPLPRTGLAHPIPQVTTLKVGGAHKKRILKVLIPNLYNCYSLKQS